MSPARKVAVVTGGAGFIGSHMVDVLLERDYRVRVIDNLTGGRTANLAQHARDPDLSFEESDIRDLVPESSLFRGADYVFHFAGIGDIVPSIERPLEYMNTNVQGTVHVLEAARHARVRKFVYAASSSCYGIAATPTREDHPISPQYPYALSKYQGEQAAFHWRRVYRLPVNSVRIFNAYGTRVRTTGAYGAVFGGNQMRPNLHVDDMVDAYHLMLTAPHEKIHGETFNIGFQNYSIAEIAGMVKKVVQEEMPEKGEIKIVTTPTNDMRSYHVNSDKVNRVLGFKPKHSIEDAVRDLTRAFRNHLMPNSFDDDWYYNVRTMKKLGAK